MEANKRELDVDWDQFYPLLLEILRRVPQLNETYLESLINSPGKCFIYVILSDISRFFFNCKFRGFFSRLQMDSW